MKNTIILLILVLCSPFMSILFPQDISTIAGVDFKIVTSKNTYLLGELAWYEAEIIIDKSIKLDYYPSMAPMTYFRIKVTDSLNQEIPYRGWYPEMVFSKKNTEYPDTILSVDRLDFGYPEESIYPKRIRAYYYPEGEYKVCAELSLHINNLQYIVKSNIVQFSVQKPEGDEQMAYEDYKRVKLFLDKDFTQMTNDTKNEVTNFINKYPSSVYVEKLLMLTGYSLTKDLNKKEQIDYYFDLIQKYPENYSNVYNLMSMITTFAELKDRSGFESYLGNLNKIKGQSTILNILHRMFVGIYGEYIKTNKF